MESTPSKLFGRLKHRLLGLSPSEASFARRGFPGGQSPSRGHLEKVIETFIAGYNLALRDTEMFRIAERLDASFPPALVGFAYEGAGLYFGLLDLFVPRSESRLAAFVRGAARPFDFITMVGAGFAVARAPLGLRRLEAYQATLDPMNGWCLADGYGFHQGFFHWQRFIEERRPAPASLNPQNRALFDAGVGRAMWWVFGADPASIAAAIGRIEGGRRPEMWAGIGTALAYASGGGPGTTSALLDLSGAYRPDFLSGIPLAAHMRDKGRNPAAWTETVCAELLGLSVAAASGLVIAELTAFLDSWRGSERDKWAQCYLALRDRLKRHLADGAVKPIASPTVNGALISH